MIKVNQSQPRVMLGVLLLALAGLGLTGYLSFSHVSNQAPAFCSQVGKGCDLVLHSSYAEVWGLPVSGFGALNYLAIAVLAALGLFNSARFGQISRFLIFGLSTAAIVFTGYLVWVILFVLSSSPVQPIFCVYCFSSATLVSTIWSLNLLGNYGKSPDWGNLLFTGFMVAVISLTVTAGVYANQGEQGLAAPLASHLRQQGAKMYGAYWCPHCQEQKAMFGEAVNQVPYVECDPRPQNAQPLVCQAKQIRSYPTWEIKGKLFEGVRSLAELAQISDFRG